MSILRACPFHLLEQVAALPSSLHNLIIHAAFPGLESGELTLPCSECAIQPATQALHLFANLPEERQKRLNVSGINCMVSPSDQGQMPGKCAGEFRRALLRCCRSATDLSLSLEGHRAYLTPVFQALASSSTLRTLSLTLPSSYSFQSTGPGSNEHPEDSANSVANAFMFVTSLSSLTIDSTQTSHQLQRRLLMHQHQPTITCWDASCSKMLTHLSMIMLGSWSVPNTLVRQSHTVWSSLTLACTWLGQVWYGQ